MIIFNAIRGLDKLNIRQPRVRTLSQNDVIVRVPAKGIRNQKRFEASLSRFGKLGVKFIDKQGRLCFLVHSKAAAKDRRGFADAIRETHRAKLNDMVVTAAFV